MINVLVTGSNGQLGSTLKDLADKYEDDFIFIFTSSNDLNICNPEDINNILSNYNFHYCINCAAYTNVELAETEKVKAFDVNSDGVRSLAYFCERFNVTLIHISTDYVFDGEKGSEYNEDDKVNPINIYGETKMYGEDFIEFMMKKYYIIRTSWLYSQFGKNFFNTVLTKLDNDEHMRVATDQLGTPTSTYSLGEAIIFMMLNDSRKYGTYHVANEGTVSWYEFATEISLLHNKGEITPIDSYPTEAKRPIFSSLDSSKFKKTFNYDMPNWLDSLEEVYNKK